MEEKRGHSGYGNP
ncbi:unnamed protein product [Lathyrus sativus]|nr:unnamed protein product [Lathyrus sativus]